MSVKVMSWVWDRSLSEGNDRLVLLAIADHANHDGRDAYPAIETLAEMTNLSPRTVQRAISRLVELGELRVELNAGGGSDWRTDRRPNRYQVLLAHAPETTRRALRRASRHGASPVSPRAESANDTTVFPQAHDLRNTSTGPSRERGDSCDAPSSDARGDTGDGHGVTADAPRGDTGDALPVLDPSKEPSTSPNPHVVGARGTRVTGTNPRALGTDPRSKGTNPRASTVDAFFADDRRDDPDPVDIGVHLRRMHAALGRGLDTEGAQR